MASTVESFSLGFIHEAMKQNVGPAWLLVKVENLSPGFFREREHRRTVANTGKSQTCAIWKI